MNSFKLSALALATLFSTELIAAEHSCAAVAAPMDRLACYDAAFPPVSSEPVRIETPDQSEQRVRQDFGLGSSEIQRRRPELSIDPEVDSIVGVVQQVRSLSGGQRLVELKDGQGWRVIEGSSRGPLREGDTITITRAALGSYRLITPGGVGLRVRRVH